MIAELDRVALNDDVPSLGLRRGDVGVVVHVFGEGDGYVVEFMTLMGDTIGVENLPGSAVRPLRSDEVASARPLERLAS